MDPTAIYIERRGRALIKAKQILTHRFLIQL